VKNYQASLDETSRAKKDLEDNLKKKDQELNNLVYKGEEDQAQIANLLKKIKDLQVNSFVFI
jgi:hypothetical protein